MQQLILSFQKNESIQVTELDADYDFLCGLPKSNLEITKNELESNLEHYNLLDVREDYERAQHHIGGQHIPLGELKYRLHEVSQDKDLVVYCKAGMRSKMAIQIIKESGFKMQLLNLKGGILNQ